MQKAKERGSVAVTPSDQARAQAKLRSAWTWCAAILVAMSLAVWWAQYGLRVAPTETRTLSALLAPLDALGDDPPVLAASQWIERRAPFLRNAFQTQVYGELPAATRPERGAARLIDENAFGGAGRIEEFTVTLAGDRRPFEINILVATPAWYVSGRAPVVVAPNFCGNRAALGYRYSEVSSPLWTAPRCRNIAGREITEALHGDSIIRVPFADLLRAGYAVMSFSPGEVVPDDAKLAPEAISRLPRADNEGPEVGAVGAWAWSISRVIDTIETDTRLDAGRIALFGHSRFGKAALLAAALDMRIKVVIANQSGRLGAAPTSDRLGEPISDLFANFPHWFPAQARHAPVEAGGLDQQFLLALIAPRGVLLGGASLDRWSDPEGAFQSARSASDVYRLLGGTGLDQISMKATNLDADIAYYFRSGGHGVRRSDWLTAILFLDRRFGARPAASRQLSEGVTEDQAPERLSEPGRTR